MTSLKQLWTLRSLAEMNDEDFRNLCSSFSGKESTKDLTPQQRDKVKSKLWEMYPFLKSQKKQAPRKRSQTQRQEGVFTFPSAEQKEHARELFNKLQILQPSEITLDTQAFRMYKKSSFNKLDRFQMQGLIESLKGMIRRAAMQIPERPFLREKDVL